jgi:hypothetical protein
LATPRLYENGGRVVLTKAGELLNSDGARAEKYVVGAESF